VSAPDGEDAGKRLKRHQDVGRKAHLHRVGVQVVAGDLLGKLAGEKPLVLGGVVRRVVGQPDPVDVDRQDVAGLGAIDVDRSGDGVRSAVVHRAVDLFDLALVDAGSDLPAARGHRLDRDRVTGVDVQDGGDVVVVDAPLGRLRGRREHPESVPVLRELLCLHVCLVRRAFEVGDGVVGVRAVRIRLAALSRRGAVGTGTARGQ